MSQSMLEEWFFVLWTYMDVSNDTQTNYSTESCTKLIHRLEHRKECLCGDEDPSGTGQILSEEECNKECGGDSNKKCGAGWRLSVYKTGLDGKPV